MGNKKNKKNNCNNHRHVYFKKKNPAKNSFEMETKTSKCKNTTTHTEMGNIKGNRLVNMDKLQKYTHDLTKHATQCSGAVNLVEESRDGLASVLTGRCTDCMDPIIFETSTKVKGPRGYSRWESNMASVWGQMVTGGGHSHLEEMMSVMGVPVMTKASFVNTERDVGDYWKTELAKSMAEAGAEEKRLAEERGDYHEGVPAITVIIDGGWSKRSHKHSYNANSGVAIIIGKQTGKLLYIGIRNRYCAACARNIPRDKHVCFKNWEASSSQMETDIIVEGFLEAEKVHGVRYTRFIGDGDSSVYPTLLQSIPVWGHAIKKIECANHACKCYRGALERIAQENPSYKGKGGLTQKMRRKLVSAARSAIRMRSTESDRGNALNSLRKDLMNGPRHCFGHHDYCSPDFCTMARERMEQASSFQNGTTSSLEDNTDEVESHLDGK